MSELLEHVPLNFICMAVLCALGLRRLVRIERLYWLRVVILTGLIWVPAIYLFLLACPMLTETDCMPLGEVSGTFTITE